VNLRSLKDSLAGAVMRLVCLGVLSLAFLMGFGLLYRSWPILAMHPLSDLLLSNQWQPAKGSFGLGAFLAGTLWVTGIAMVVAVPLSISTAVFLEEYAPRALRVVARPVVDVLAGISPVIYGVWGVLAIVPLVRDRLMPFFQDHLASFPFKSDNYTGYSALSGGIVLAVMVAPLIIAITQEVIRTVPQEIREASLALGATRWETIKHTVLKRSRMGIVAAVILGLSRAFGETIAVLMVSGCAMHSFPKSIFDPAYPLPALIANTYGEMMSVPLYDAAILLAAFLLFSVTTLFNMAGWGILLHLERAEN
jgi:phosphate transport system permease protein